MAALEAKLVIGAEDHTAAAFADVQKKIEGVSKAARQMAAIKLPRDMNVLGGTGWEKLDHNMGDLGSKWKAYNESMAAASATIAEAGAAMGTPSLSVSKAEAKVGLLSKAFQGLGSSIKNVGALASTALAFEGMRVAGKSIHSAASVADETARLKALNVPAEKIEWARKQATELAAKYPVLTPGDVIAIDREGLSILTEPEEAKTNLEPFVRTKAAMRGLGMNEEDAKYIFKSAEDLGRALDSERLKIYLDTYIKGAEAGAGLSKLQEQYEFGKYLKSPRLTLSVKFINSAVTQKLIQDLGGERAGHGIFMAIRTATGTALQNAHERAKEWARMGLIAPGDLDILPKTGAIKGLKKAMSRSVRKSRLQTLANMFMKYCCRNLKCMGIKLSRNRFPRPKGC